jgi:mRNA interferase MazF
MNKIVSYGDIYKVDFGKHIIGSEQGGIRPAIVVSNNKFNMHSSAMTVVPLTSQMKNSPVHVFINKLEYNIGLEQDSIALIEQIRTIDKKRIVSYIGECPHKLMSKIELAMQIQLNINNKTQEIDITDFVELFATRVKGGDKFKMGLAYEMKKFLDISNVEYKSNVNKYVKELKDAVCLV